MSETTHYPPPAYSVPVYPVIVALDGLSENGAADLITQLQHHVWGFKIHDLLIRHGVSIIEKLKKNENIRIFCDLKLHDIPNTVKHQVHVLKEGGADLVTVHCSGGEDMLAAAQLAASGSQLKLLGVTVLTALDDQACQQIYGKACVSQVQQLAKLALHHLDGIVCSGHELSAISALDLDKKLQRIVPGIRPAIPQSIKPDDQRRSITADDALKAGADLLVVGRPITEASDPLQACHYLFS